MTQRILYPKCENCGGEKFHVERVTKPESVVVPATEYFALFGSPTKPEPFQTAILLGSYILPEYNEWKATCKGCGATWTYHVQVPPQMAGPLFSIKEGE